MPPERDQDQTPRRMRGQAGREVAQFYFSEMKTENDIEEIRDFMRTPAHPGKPTPAPSPPPPFNAGREDAYPPAEESAQEGEYAEATAADFAEEIGFDFEEDEPGEAVGDAAAEASLAPPEVLVEWVEGDAEEEAVQVFPPGESAALEEGVLPPEAAPDDIMLQTIEVFEEPDGWIVPEEENLPAEEILPESPPEDSGTLGEIPPAPAARAEEKPEPERMPENSAAEEAGDTPAPEREGTPATDRPAPEPAEKTEGAATPEPPPAAEPPLSETNVQAQASEAEIAANTAPPEPQAPGMVESPPEAAIEVAVETEDLDEANAATEAEVAAGGKAEDRLPEEPKADANPLEENLPAGEPVSEATESEPEADAGSGPEPEIREEPAKTEMKTEKPVAVEASGGEDPVASSDEIEALLSQATSGAEASTGEAAADAGPVAATEQGPSPEEQAGGNSVEDKEKIASALPESISAVDLKAVGNEELGDSGEDESGAPPPKKFLLPADSPLFLAAMAPLRVFRPFCRRLDQTLQWRDNWRFYLTVISVIIITICLAVWIGSFLNTGVEV